MPDEVPRSAIESAIHEEKQQAARPEPKGALEGLRELWGVSAATLAAKGVEFLGTQMTSIGQALEHIGKDALAGAQHAYHTSFFSVRDLGHLPPTQTPKLHDNAPVVSAVEQPTVSYDDLLRAQNEMAPPRDEPASEQELEQDKEPDR